MFKKVTVLAVACVMALAACSSEPTGTLDVLIDPEGEINGFGEFSLGTQKSFGIFICTIDGAVQLNSIEATAIEGGAELLGAVVYTSPDKFVGAAHGFPTDGLDPERIEPLEEALVDVDCAGPEGDERVQLIVGAERTSHLGGSIQGLRIDTSGGVVDVDYTILLCGDRLEFCEMLTEEG